MFDEFASLCEKFLLGFIAREERNAEDLRDFHDHIAGIEVGKRTYFLELRQGKSIGNLNKGWYSRTKFNYLLLPFEFVV